MGLMRKLLRLRENISRNVYITASITMFLVVLVIWSILTYGRIVKPIFLPSPSAVLSATLNLFIEHGLLSDILFSMYRIVVGFLVAAVIAVPIGILIGSFKLVEAFVEPINDFIRYMPVVAFIPLCILWVGIGDLEKILIIFIGTYFQLVLMVAAGVAQVPKEYLETSYMLGGSSYKVLLKVVLPAARPGILDSLRIAMGWAWSYLVVAEIVASNSGIGFMIIQGLRFLKTANVVAGIILIGLLGLGTDYLFKLISRKMCPWTQI